MSKDARLRYRSAQFWPLSDEESQALGVLAIVDATDISPSAPKPPGASPDALHLAIKQFLAEQKTHYGLQQLVGYSPVIQQVRAQVCAAAAAGASAAIVGPAGTGRQHVAKAIHYRAAPPTAPSLALLDGAVADASQIDAAVAALGASASDGAGSLLVTEADALSAAAQRHLAGILATASRPPWRVLSTTGESLTSLAAQGQFDQHLAFALSTIEIHLPPLGQRMEDLPILVQTLIERQNQGRERQLAGISSAALDLLAGYHWPGNLDELTELLEAAGESCDGDQIQREHLPSRLRHAISAAAHRPLDEDPIILEDVLARIESELITRAMDRSGGNKAKAARLLGMKRPRLYRRMLQLGLIEEGESP